MKTKKKPVRFGPHVKYNDECIICGDGGFARCVEHKYEVPSYLFVQATHLSEPNKRDVQALVKAAKATLADGRFDIVTNNNNGAVWLVFSGIMKKAGYTPMLVRSDLIVLAPHF